MRKSFLATASAAALVIAAAPALSTEEGSTGGIDTRNFTAGIQGALQGDTGFMTGGQVVVNGIGTGNVTLNRNNASINVNTGASGTGGEDAPTANAFMNTTFDFDRQVTTNAALVGRGSVVAQGESMGGTGVVGTAFSTSEASGVSGTGQAFSALADAEGSGSLVGSFSTRNTINLQGQSELFAAAQELDLRERNVGRAAGQTGEITAGSALNFAGLDLGLGAGQATANVTGALSDPEDDKSPLKTIGELVDALPGINRNDLLNSGQIDFAATLDVGASIELQVAGVPLDFDVSLGDIKNSGAGFGMLSIVPSGAQQIELDVASAGGGSISVSGSTGGFFGQGTTFSAFGESSLSDVGGFFDNDR